MAHPSIDPADDSSERFEHPRGTIVIVFLFGLLFALGWFGMYFLLFLRRGGLHF